MKSRAAIAFEAGKPLEIVEVDVEGPKQGEVLVEIRATGVCHTDDFTISGADDSCEDPLLAGPLSGTDYGMMPGPGSPAIDTGDDGVCPSVDVLGSARPSDGNGDGSTACDIGAYEMP